MRTLLDERNMHLAFEANLLFKGAFALAEIIAGVFGYLATPQDIVGLVHGITQAKLSEDPHDFVARSLVLAAHGLSASSRHFAAFYLLSHGLVKLRVIIGLWRGRHAYYPAAIALFGAFILH